MNKDHLEEFIRENRPMFDDATPAPEVWDRILVGLGPAARVVPWRTWLYRAAAVLLIFSSSWLIHDMVYHASEDRIGTAEQQILSPEASELLEAELWYGGQIATAQEELVRLTADLPGLREEINAELAGLDTAYAELKRDLGDEAANEEIIAAMIQNYRMKLMILEDILAQVRENKPEERRATDYEI